MVKNRLKEIRLKEYMMSSKEFSKILGIKLTTYSQWENGNTVPALGKIFEVAKILKK